MVSSFHVLCVEDDANNFRLLESIFRREAPGLLLKCASTAEEATLLMTEERFDAYILDYVLPTLSGVELCRRIRLRDPRSPIVFFSALRRRDDRKNAHAAGADDYLIKPDDLDKLAKTVRRFLDERPPEAALETNSEAQFPSRKRFISGQKADTDPAPFDYENEISLLTFEQRLRFYELFAHNLTVCIRSIWSAENVSDAEKLDRIKLVNEISHRIIGKISHLRLNRNEWSEADTWRMINEYISENENIRGEIFLAVTHSFKAVNEISM